MLVEKILAHFHPERFQGWGADKNYFEGWYYKWVSADEKHALAIIPGIAIDGDGQGHAFIQVLDGTKCESDYYRFSLEDFKCDYKRFWVKIGNCEFSSTHFKVDLPGFNGELHFSSPALWPNPWYAPGIMGPFSWLKFMECNHGIVSMDHGIEGTISYRGESVDFTGGRGYTEKDWGRSFPSGYIWMQSNHFERKGISFKFSIAKIPFLNTSFIGFIGGLYIDGTFIRFTTYNLSRVLDVVKNKNSVKILIQNPKYKLLIEAVANGATAILAAPKMGIMDAKVAESMTSTIKLTLTRRADQKVIFEGQGRNAGLELGGDINQVLEKWDKKRRKI